MQISQLIISMATIAPVDDLRGHLQDTHSHTEQERPLVEKYEHAYKKLLATHSFNRTLIILNLLENKQVAVQLLSYSANSYHS